MIHVTTIVPEMLTAYILVRGILDDRQHVENDIDRFIIFFCTVECRILPFISQMRRRVPLDHLC